jgi:hypothetical protein
MAFAKFPYPLERLSGAVDFNLLNRQVQVELTGNAGARPVFITGHWSGEGVQADASFDIRASDLTIDETLLKALSALPPETQTLARSFHAEGKLDVKAHVRHEPGAKEYRNEYHVRFHDASVRWDDFPYALTDVAGVLDIYPGHWEFHDFRGKHKDGQVAVKGRSTPKVHLPTGERSHGVSVEIQGRDIAMDDDLRQALRQIRKLQDTWDNFRPSGRLTFTAAIERPTPLSDDLGVQVELRGCAVEPKFFAYPLDDVSGQFRYGQHRLELMKVQAHHGATTLALERGTVDLHAGHYADLEIQAQDLRIDEALAQALPKKLQGAARALKIEGPLQLKTRLVIGQLPNPATPPDVFWDGQLWMRDAKLTTGMELSGVTGTVACVGRHDGQQLLGVEGNVSLDRVTVFKQPFANVQAPFQVRKEGPDALLVRLRAPIYGGDIAGEVCVHMNAPVRYELNLTASQIDLGEFGKQNLGADNTQLQGIAVGRLHMTGAGTGIDSLEGNGSLDVPNGRLGKDLPFLLDLIKFLGLHWPDRTAFEEMHARFSVLGKRVNIGRLELLSNAISLTGKGEINLDGTDAQVDFYPTLARFGQALPPLMRPLVPTVSKNILTIEVRGKVGARSEDLRFHKKLVPVVVDPLLVLRDRMMGAEEKKK